MANNTILRNIRLAFPCLYEKTSYKGTKDPKTDAYSATFLLIKTDKKQVKLVNEAMREAKKGTKLISCVKDGDIDPYCAYDGHENHWVIKAKSRREISLLDNANTPCPNDTGLFYTGCNVDVILSFRAAGEHLACYINAVRFNSDNKKFSSDKPLTHQTIVNMFDGDEKPAETPAEKAVDTTIDMFADMPEEIESDDDLLYVDEDGK